MTDKPHLTTRRGFIATAGFGGTALYGLWVGYGAAPGPLALLGAAHHTDATRGTEHAAHVTGRADTMSPEAFEERVRDFVARFGEADGSVRPRRDGVGDEVTTPLPHLDAHATHATHGEHAGHGDHGEHSSPQPADAETQMAPVDAIEVWLQAAQFVFEPGHFRMVANQPYRFRMMATDVAHGASIQFGRGGRMIRLRPGQLIETAMTFARPGEFLIYCTVYCGAGHDAMQARLSVIEGGES